MSNWAGLQEWARERYTLENDEDDWFAMTVEYDDGRSQKVVVSRFTYLDGDWAEIRSAICEESEMSPRLALKKNAEFAIGGIGLKDGRYYLFYSVPLADLSEDEFVVPLNAIAASADRLEASHSSGDDDF
jgi:regulation of enolase protein 1 (concanavalin A-like superfamily)